RADAAGDLVARLDAGARLAQAGAAIRGERARGAERAGSRPRPQAARPRAVRVVAPHAVEAARRAVRIARAAAVEHPRIVQPLLADAELALPGAGAALAHHPAERAVPVGRRAALGAGAVPQAGIAVRIRRAGAVLHAGAVERAGPLEAIDPRPDEVAGEDVHPHLHAVLLAAAAARGDADLHLTVAEVGEGRPARVPLAGVVLGRADEDVPVFHRAELRVDGALVDGVAGAEGGLAAADL